MTLWGSLHQQGHLASAFYGQVFCHRLDMASSNEEHLNQGGMVCFLFDQGSDKLRLLVNLDAMQASGLSMSSKLLKFAKIIKNSG